MGCCFNVRKKSLQDLVGFSVKNIRLLSFNELRSATDNFHPSNRIGRGGFGTVYKGILKNGTPIAAKVLSAESRQGVNEFLTEIDVITNVKHPNLVELLGCCVQGSNRILVYEFVENNSLERSLLGLNSQTAELNWRIRSAICLGAAKGLAYLHEEIRPYIVHRDIKASNILLDKSFNPKIGDFGLAKLFPDNITHISTRVAGTTGYLAPEYAMQGQLTRKADVYSFGVLMLEIISGKSSSKSSWSEMEKSLLEWVIFQEKATGRKLGTDTWHDGLWYLDREGLDPALVSMAEKAGMRGLKMGANDTLLLHHWRLGHSSFGTLSQLYPAIYEKTNKEKLTWQLYEEERLIELVDRSLGEYSEEEALRYIKVALFCTQGAADRRPCMTQVVEMLSKPIRLNEKELRPPGLLHDSSRTGKDSKGRNSGSSMVTKDTSTITTLPYGSTTVTMTEMHPR